MTHSNQDNSNDSPVVLGHPLPDKKEEEIIEDTDEKDFKAYLERQTKR